MKRKLVHNLSLSQLSKVQSFLSYLQNLFAVYSEKGTPYITRRVQGYFFVFLEDTGVTFTNGKHCSDGWKI
jgi:hypothetical protein